MSQLLDGITGIICHADDVLVCGKDKTQHDERLTEVLFTLQKAGLTLNEKCSFAQSEVLFVGHRVSAEGIAPDPEKVRAIVEMTTPQNVADVRRFLGMATYMSKFIPHFTDDTKPLRDLLAKQNGWIWGSVQQAAFEKIKSDLASTQVLAQYKPEAKTKVSTDASSFGLGAVLSQMQNEKEWRPVAFISRSLSETEQRYAQVEKEALAVTWACERLSSYLIGLHFTIETDHKPLLALLGTKALDDFAPQDSKIPSKTPEIYIQHSVCSRQVISHCRYTVKSPYCQRTVKRRKGTGKRSTSVCGCCTSLLASITIKATTNSRWAATWQNWQGADRAM